MMNTQQSERYFSLSNDLKKAYEEFCKARETKNSEARKDAEYKMGFIRGQMLEMRHWFGQPQVER